MALVTIPVTIALTYVEASPENRAKHTVSRAVYSPEIEGDVTVRIHDTGKSDVQVELNGTARALEELGVFLVALGRLDSNDPSPHEHFQFRSGAKAVELIVRRRQ